MERPKIENYSYRETNNLHTQKYVDDLNAFIDQEKAERKWISVEDRPLYEIDDGGNWICTKDGDNEFIAAVPYVDKNKPGEELWWIHHCVVEDKTGLCIVGDDWNEPAGWDLTSVTYWQLWPAPPNN